MLIIDSRRYTSVLVIVNNMISRKGLVLLSYIGAEVAIDTPSIAVNISFGCIDYARKFTSKMSRLGIYISEPIYAYLSRAYNYRHIKFEAIHIGDYLPQMLFVGVVGCKLLPPMRYAISCKMKNLCHCRVDYSDRLPIGITLQN